MAADQLGAGKSQVPARSPPVLQPA